MKTEWIGLDSLLLGGVSFYGDPFSRKGGWDEENEIGRTCRRFMDFISENPERPYSSDGPYLYEVHIFNAETAAKGCFEVFVGEEVNTAHLPVTLGTKFIPASEYLKVTLMGKEIISDWWQKLDTEILPSSGYKRNDTYLIQVYDERFKGTGRIEDSEMEAFIPVERI